MPSSLRPSPDDHKVHSRQLRMRQVEWVRHDAAGPKPLRSENMQTDQTFAFSSILVSSSGIRMQPSSQFTCTPLTRRDSAGSVRKVTPSSCTSAQACPTHTACTASPTEAKKAFHSGHRADCHSGCCYRLSPSSTYVCRCDTLRIQSAGSPGGLCSACQSMALEGNAAA